MHSFRHSIQNRKSIQRPQEKEAFNRLYLENKYLQTGGRKCLSHYPPSCRFCTTSHLFPTLCSTAPSEGSHCLDVGINISLLIIWLTLFVIFFFSCFSCYFLPEDFPSRQVSSDPFVSRFCGILNHFPGTYSPIIPT